MFCHRLPPQFPTRVMRFLLVPVVALVLYAIPCGAGTIETDTRFDSLVDRGMDRMFRLDFDAADAALDSVVRLYPDHPAGYLLKGSLLCSEILLGYASMSDAEARFKSMCSKTVEKAQKSLDRGEAEAENLFFVGGAFALLARYDLAKGSWVGAVYNGKQSKSYLEAAVEADPKLFDAYMGIGLYNYYAAVLPDVVDALASFFGLGGNKSLGIEQVKLSVSRGKYSKGEAELFLGDILVEEGNFEGGFEIYQRYVKRFPENAFFAVQLGVIQMKMDDHYAARKTLGDALVLARQGISFSAMLAAYYLGRSAESFNQHEAARDYYLMCLEEVGRYELFENFNGWVEPAALYQLGEMYEYLGDRANAVQCYQGVVAHRFVNKSLRKSAKDRLAHPIAEIEKEINIAVNLQEVGQTDSGLVRLQNIRSRLESGTPAGEQKRLAYVCYHIGKGHLRLNNYTTAIELFEVASHYYEEYAEKKRYSWMPPHIHYRKASAFLNLNQKHQALKEYQQALSFDDYYAEMRLRFKAGREMNGL